MFRQNCSKLDRTVRLIMGIILLPISLFILDGPTSLIAAAISVLWLLTGATGFCVLYLPFGFSTNKHKEQTS